MSKVTDEMQFAFREAYMNEAGASHNDRMMSALQALFDAKLISLPVDEAKVREAAIRECIAALPDESIYDNGGLVIDACEVAIQSLLPTKDRAEELAKEWAADESGTGGSELVTNGYHQVMLKQFARWLIEREG